MDETEVSPHLMSLGDELAKRIIDETETPIAGFAILGIIEGNLHSHYARLVIGKFGPIKD